MATLIAVADGNLTGSTTFAAAEVGALALNLVRNTTTTVAAAASVTSATFTVTTAKVIDAVLLWVKQSAAGSTGTFKVDLQKSAVSQGSVTVNKTDLPDTTNANPVPVLFKLGATATGDGAATWTIVITTTGTNTVTYNINAAGVTNLTRALRTTTTATPTAADDLYVIGELTGAGTHNSRIVTMDSTAATTYGNGALNSTSVAGGGIHVSNWGTLTYGTTAGINYLLRVAGDVIVYQFGTFNMGSSAATVFTPASLTGLIGWWDASVTASLNLTGSSINSVADQSGGGNTMNWVNAKPTYNATGFNTTKPAMVFGSSSALEAAAFPMGTGKTLTAWYVGMISTGADGDRALSLRGSAPANDYSNQQGFGLLRNSSTSISFVRFFDQPTGSGLALSTPYRVIATVNSSGQPRLYINGVSVGTTANDGGAWSNGSIASIGRMSSSGNYWTGPIAECGIATGFSDATTVGYLDDYLKTKWGL